MPVKRIPTERLFLRPMQNGDEKYTFPEVNKELTKYWIGWEPAESMEEERHRIIKITRDKNKREFLAFSRSTKEFAGVCGLAPPEESEKKNEIELIVWVKKALQGQGYGYEMSKALLEWAAKNTDLRKIIYSVTEGNEASARLQKKLGGSFFMENVFMKRGKMLKVRDYEIKLREKNLKK